MNRRIVHILCSLSLAGQLMPVSLAASQPDLNFKIYAPPDAGAPATAPAEPKRSAPAAQAPAAAPADKDDSLWSLPGAEKPQADPDTAGSSTAPSTTTTDATASPTAPAVDPLTTDEASAKPAGEATASPATEASSPAGDKADKKVLQGYIRVVPSGTKVPIIMDTAIDTDTSQEGDEFAARTSEDLEIDGQTVVPAGSIIKGRIAALNAPRNLSRSGSVALKFDTVTTPDNRQIPLVANLVAHGGVVHARRGMKDIAIDTGTFALPTLLGVGIGVLAGSAHNNNNNTKTTNGTSSSHKVNSATGAMIGAGVGAAVGIAILCIKKGKKVDVRPGDELKIELAEDLRMPM